ncbi:MAG: hypothetical protein QUS14_08845 [Pyrinomonadaceae bacterium]|nr:hypothetical protein [Pyrinomonadaceae bacterium]
MKNAISTLALMILLAAGSGIVYAQARWDYSEADAQKWTAHFRSQEALTGYLQYWHLRADKADGAAKPMTRFDFVWMFYFHIDRLTDLAVFKLKLKTSEEFYAFARANPEYAINFPYSASGVPAGTATAVFRDVPRNDNIGYEVLDKLGVNFCDKAGDCHPEQEITEREFYEWVGKVYGVKFDNVSATDMPMQRGAMVAPLVLAIQTNFERVIRILDARWRSSQTADVIKRLPSKGRARITDRSKLYLPDSPCVDLSGASEDLKQAFAGGGAWGDYRAKNGDEGDIIFETANTCEAGKITLLRVGTAIVTMSDKGVKRLR